MDDNKQQPIVGNDAFFIIGEPLIDSEHEALLRLLEHLHAPSDAGTGHDDFLAKFGRLGCELARHFVHEEALMQSLRMPEALIVEHIRAHERIIDKYVEINVALLHGKPYSKEELLPKIRTWILDHIQSCDLKIKAFVDQARAGG